MFKKILLANDGSEASLHAARLAIQLSRIHGAALSAVFVVDPYPFIGIGQANPAGFDAYMAAARQSAIQAHLRVLDLARSMNHAGDINELTVEDASATEGIVKTAQDLGANLIVMGSHGRSGVVRLLMGSVAQKVSTQSPVSVLLCK